MKNDHPVSGHTSSEQIRYADFLLSGAWYALVFMAITYILYVSGIREPYLPLKQVPLYWALSAEEYARQAHIPPSWEWAKLAGRGDFLTYWGPVLLLSLPLIYLFSLLPSCIRQKDRIFTIIVVAQMIVMVLAASDIFR